MNIDIINSMPGYIETLYYINKNFIKLCGADIIYNDSDLEKIIFDIIFNVPRMIPYEFKNGKLELKDRDGLLEYKNIIVYLENEYENILNQNEKVLDNIRKINNSYKHKMHGAKIDGVLSNPSVLFEIEFEVDVLNNNIITKYSIKISDNDLIGLIKLLNNLFSKIVNEIISSKDDLGYLFKKRIRRFSFTDFNSLYNNRQLLITVGKIMYDY